MEIIGTILRTNQLRVCRGRVSRRTSLATTIRRHYPQYPQERTAGVTVLSLEPWRIGGMNRQVNDNVIDEIVATCNGDIRGALKALMLVNERLECELQQLYAAVDGIGPVERRTGALH
jgi:hypothetical protein